MLTYNIIRDEYQSPLWGIRSFKNKVLHAACWLFIFVSIMQRQLSKKHTEIITAPDSVVGSDNVPAIKHI